MPQKWGMGPGIGRDGRFHSGGYNLRNVPNKPLGWRPNKPFFDSYGRPVNHFEWMQDRARQQRLRGNVQTRQQRPQDTSATRAGASEQYGESRAFRREVLNATLKQVVEETTIQVPGNANRSVVALSDTEPDSAYVVSPEGSIIVHLGSEQIGVGPCGLGQV
jgi:hypothetical protein